MFHYSEDPGHKRILIYIHPKKLISPGKKSGRSLFPNQLIQCFIEASIHTKPWTYLIFTTEFICFYLYEVSFIPVPPTNIQTLYDPNIFKAVSYSPNMVIMCLLCNFRSFVTERQTIFHANLLCGNVSKHQTYHRQPFWLEPKYPFPQIFATKAWQVHTCMLRV